MNTYRIEQKILTLAECAVMEDREKPASFQLDDVEFSHWDFNFMAGWINDAWIAIATINAENYRQAYACFNNKLSKIIPRISLISQVYIEYLIEPFLINKNESDIAFFRYTKDTRPVELMFAEEELRALEILIRKTEISDEFFYYWNDATNTIGYSAKILLMFSAVEALAKKLAKESKQNGGRKSKEDFEKEILGDDLYKECFKKTTGLRNRLVHGDYFQLDDSKKNYVETIHKKVISYFNKKVFKKNLIEENVINPQRNFWFNKEGGEFFIKIKNKNQKFSLKEVLNEFSNDEFFQNSLKYECVNLPKNEMEKY